MVVRLMVTACTVVTAPPAAHKPARYDEIITDINGRFVPVCPHLLIDCWELPARV